MQDAYSWKLKFSPCRGNAHEVLLLCSRSGVANHQDVTLFDQFVNFNPGVREYLPERVVELFHTLQSRSDSSIAVEHNVYGIELKIVWPGVPITEAPDGVQESLSVGHGFIVTGANRAIASVGISATTTTASWNWQSRSFLGPLNRAEIEEELFPIHRTKSSNR